MSPHLTSLVRLNTTTFVVGVITIFVTLSVLMSAQIPPEGADWIGYMVALAAGGLLLLLSAIGLMVYFGAQGIIASLQGSSEQVSAADSAPTHVVAPPSTSSE